LAATNDRCNGSREKMLQRFDRSSLSYGLRGVMAKLDNRMGVVISAAQRVLVIRPECSEKPISASTGRTLFMCRSRAREHHLPAAR
jgi:hypothetical protein